MNNILDKQITVNGETFDVTATHSDTADKVTHKLTINRSGKAAVEFDGSNEDKSVDIVDVSGGTYTGPVKIIIPEGSTETIGADEDIPTIKHVNDLVAELKGVPLLSWENGTLQNIKKDDGITVLPIKIVHGTLEGYGTFCEYIKSSKGYYLYLAKVSESEDREVGSTLQNGNGKCRRGLRWASPRHLLLFLLCSTKLRIIPPLRQPLDAIQRIMSAGMLGHI